MFVRRLALSLIVLCVPAAAQSVYSPAPDFASKEGGVVSFLFGAHPKGRTQLADGSLLGKARAISRVSYRSDFDNHSQLTSMGRAWSNVTLFASEFDMSKISKSPGANVKGTPTRVFSGSMSWPSRLGTPPARPANSWFVSVPFRNAWLYSGKEDLLLDYSFAGGVLASAGPWPITFPNRVAMPYALDGFRSGDLIRGREIRYGNTGFGMGCPDTGNPVPYGRTGAWTSLFFEHWGKGTNFPNQFRAAYKVDLVGPQTTVITTIGTKLIPSGVSVPGVSCNRLYVDFTSPAWLFADATSKSPFGYGVVPVRNLTGTAPNYLAPVLPALVDFPFVCQSAWDDTKTKQLRLTGASYSWLPAIPRWSSALAAPRRAVYEYVHSQLGLVQFVVAGGEYNPICWYQ